MAWESFSEGERTGVTGDRPVDILAQALNRFTAAYIDRWSRKPTLVELHRALALVLRADPGRYLADPDAALAWLSQAPPAARLAPSTIDPAAHEAAYATRPSPHYVVARRSDGALVLTIPTLEVGEGLLRVSYRIDDETLDDADAERLIRVAVLGTLCNGYYDDKAEELAIENLDSGWSRRVPL